MCMTRQGEVVMLAWYSNTCDVNNEHSSRDLKLKMEGERSQSKYHKKPNIVIKRKTEVVAANR